MKRRSRQRELSFGEWGGRRPGAGRPRKKPGNVAHRRRENLKPRFPVHATLRLERGLPSLRSRRCFQLITRAFWRGQGRFGMRLVHFSVQGNHLHLILEAPDRVAVSRAMKGLAVRIARGLNRLLGRDGRVINERYHAHILKTPSEVKRAVRYVLDNHAHHFKATGADECSSVAHPQLVVLPETWLLARAAGAG